MVTLEMFTEPRGTKILVNSVFGQDDNIIVTDRYAANYFNSDNRQICWSHLARDFTRFAHSAHKNIEEIGEYLVHTAQEVFALKKSLLTHTIDVINCQRQGKIHRQKTWDYLQNISSLPNAEYAVRVANNMMKSEKMMWKFLDDPMNIPLTNNHAERQIRHYVTYRKNSYFTQSERGNRFLERTISLYLTWKQRNENPVRNLQALLTA